MTDQTSQRDKAKFTFDKNVIVSAGAGAGKTTILIDRFSYWLFASPDNTIDKITALTFTEKAASEMKTRLSARLRDIALALDGAKDKKNAEEFIDNVRARFHLTDKEIKNRAVGLIPLLDRAEIGTIHSFCSSVIRLFSAQAGIKSSFEVDDGTVFDEVFEKEFAIYLDGELQRNSANSKLWLEVLSDVSVSDIEKLARDLCSPLMENYNPRANFTLLEKKCAEYAALARELNNKYSADFKINNMLDFAEKELSATAVSFRTGDFSADEPCSVDEDIGKKIKRWSEEDWETADKIVNFVRSVNRYNQKIFLNSYELAAQFGSIFAREYNKRGCIGYDGLLIKARDILKNSRYARQTLKEKYRVVFVDEFQDTDPLQGEMILYLCEDKNSFAGKWQDIKLAEGKLFVVGDIKQSIYGFRGADIDAYQSFIGLMGKQGALHCVLSENFRSSKPIIDFVNSAAGKIMKTAAGAPFNYQPIEFAGGSAEQSAPELCLIDFDEKKAQADDYREYQARFIARWIQENTAAGALKKRDIAILFQTTAGLEKYLDAFKQRNIPYVVEENKYFYIAQEIIDIVNLLSVIADPSDKISLVGVLRSPIFGMTDMELFLMAQAGGLDVFRSLPEKYAGAEKFYAKIKRFYELSQKISLPDLADMIYTEFDFIPALAFAYGKEQAIMNAYKLRREMEREKGTLKDFIRKSRENAHKKKGEGESPMSDDALDAVNILTIHKAKGLEFKVVIIADINGYPSTKSGDFIYSWQNSTAGFNIGGHRSAEWGLICADKKEAENEEHIRAVYVALTRARDRLIMVGDYKKMDGRGKNSVLYSLQEAGFYKYDGIEENELLFVDLKSDKELKHDDKTYETKDTNIRIADFDKWKTAWGKRCALFEQANTRVKILSPSKMWKGDDILPPESANEFPIFVGNVCHKFMQKHNFGAGIARAEIEKCARYFESEMPQDMSKKVVEECYKIISAFAKSPAYQTISGSQILAREMPFHIPWADKNTSAQSMRGIIDMVVSPGGDEVWIIDFKTDKSGDVADKYRVQTEIYKKAVSQIFNKKPAAVSAKIVSLRTAKIYDMG